MNRDRDYGREGRRQDWEENQRNDWGRQDFRTQHEDERRYQNSSAWDWSREHQRDEQRSGSHHSDDRRRNEQRGQPQWRGEERRSMRDDREQSFRQQHEGDQRQQHEGYSGSWQPRQSSWNRDENRGRDLSRQREEEFRGQQRGHWENSQGQGDYGRDRDRGYGREERFNERDASSGGYQGHGDGGWNRGEGWGNQENQQRGRDWAREDFGDNTYGQQRRGSGERDRDDRQDYERFENQDRHWRNQDAYERGLGAGGWGREGERWSERQGGGMYQGSWNANRGEEDWGRGRGREQSRRDDDYQSIRNEFYGGQQRGRPSEGQATRGMSASRYEDDQRGSRGTQGYERSPRSRRQHEESR